MIMPRTKDEQLEAALDEVADVFKGRSNGEALVKDLRMYIAEREKAVLQFGKILGGREVLTHFRRKLLDDGAANALRAQAWQIELEETPDQVGGWDMEEPIPF